MKPYDFDIGIIGGGAAGLTVASGAAQLGAKTLLIDQEPVLGGDCLHYGCVPSKTLIKSARLYHALHHTAPFGLPALSPPPVDFSRIAARIRQVIAAIQVHDSVERFTKLGVAVRFGSPSFIDPHQIDLGGKRLSARSWVIATGSSPAPPSLAALQGVPYLTNREIFSLTELPASLIVLGGGPIAIEMAQAFARLGSQVTVVQRSAQILGKEDPDLAEAVRARLEAEGVRFCLSSTLSEARSEGGEQILTLQTAQGPLELRAQAILLAQGRVPNLDGLGLERIDVRHDQRGIAVDARMRTSHRHIYAAGDVTGAHQFTHAAGYEGGIVIANAIFHLPRKADYRRLPWCTYCEPELASIGLNEKRAQAAGIDYRVRIEEFGANDRALAEGTGEGRLKLLLDRKDRPLGVQILGPSAGELLGEWVAALGGGIPLSTLAGAIHPYPTLAEINKRVAGAVIGPRIFSPKVRTVLRLLFGLRGPLHAPDPGHEEGEPPAA